MKKPIITIFFFALIILFAGCKKDKYEFYSTHVSFLNEGARIGDCGWILMARNESNKNLYLKPVRIPDGLVPNWNGTYEAKIEVLPEEYKCLFGSVDPGREELKAEKLNYANILEFKQK